ncbi:MAG: hypothetical protein IJQ76_04565 [Prevotella sp.]|nr:hypothetical protein [Prevotella sp.]
MNTELWQGIGAIADSESLMRRLTKYVRKLVKERETDSTLMTKADYYAMLDEAEQQIARGEGMKMQPGEDLKDFLKRNGYEI